MQDTPVKFQILPASVSYLISRFPVIPEFPEITCICATLIKSGESQQCMSSETMLSWFCPLDCFLLDDKRHTLRQWLLLWFLHCTIVCSVLQGLCFSVFMHPRL